MRPTPARGSGRPSQSSSSRAPKPVGPSVHSKWSLGASPTEAMSRWAHGSPPVKCWRNSAAVIAPRAARGVVGVGDLGGELATRTPRSAASARAARRRARPTSSRWPARASSLANSPPVCWPSATFIAAGEGGDVDEDVGVELVHGVGQAVGEHEPALGVGVGDLGGAAAVLRDHVAGPHRGAADGVLGDRQQAGDPDRAARRRAAPPSPRRRRRHRSCRASSSPSTGRA